MNKVFFLASALALLASCGNHDELAAPVPEQAPLSIDLLSMNYEGVMTLLSEQTSLKGVTFKDGDLTRTVGELSALDNLDPDQAELLAFNSVNPSDSLDMSVTPDYVSVCMNRNGERIAYLTYADAARQNEIINLYEEVAPATRSGNPAVTRSADGGSFKVNLTEIAMAMEKKYEAEGTYELPEKELSYQEPSAATRGLFSNLFKKVSSVFKAAPAPVVKTPTIDIYLLREKGSNPVTHEMNWQVNDAISALKDVQGNVKFNVHIANCDYRGSNDAGAALEGFTSWVKKSSYKNTNGIFILCRWGGWSHNLGMAWMNDYNVNNDLKAYGVSATNAWNKFTMAHEIGHIFGADHVSPKWYQVFWSADLMASSSYDWLSSGKHKDSGNRNVIKKNLTLN
ncbi:M12 family metallo-peptidase [Bacteroides sp.]